MDQTAISRRPRSRESHCRKTVEREGELPVLGRSTDWLAGNQLIHLEITRSLYRSFTKQISLAVPSGSLIQARVFVAVLIVIACLESISSRATAELFVSSQTAPTANSVLRYSKTNGAFLGVFASAGLNDPLGMTFGQDGNLYVASANNGRIYRYNGLTGSPLGVFASGGGLTAPINLTFGPDGNLYVSSSFRQIMRFNGQTGVFIDEFISDDRLGYPRGLKFGPDANLYVVSYNNACVLRYNGTNGAFMDTFVPAGSGGLFTPSDLAFGPDGNLYVTGGVFPLPGIFRYNGSTGTFMGKFAVVPVANQMSPIDLAFGPDGNLYVVTQSAVFSVLRFSGSTGEFMDYFVSNGSGGLSNPFGIAFAPNNPPVAQCPSPSTVECGEAVEVSVRVFDLDGDPLTVVWTANGTRVQTNSLPGGNPALAANVTLEINLPIGTNTITAWVTDSQTNFASCSTTIAVVDTRLPAISSASANPSVLWPPNHKLVRVNMSAEVIDICGAETWRIIDVASDEPVNGRGDGDTSPDWVVTSDHTVLLRAERSRKGGGRTYSITLQARDTSGNTSDAVVVRVTVPKNKRKGK